MGSSALRGIIRKGLLHSFCKKAKIENEYLLDNGSAIVFSPHFDDETLGCGGTILKKTQSGNRVQIVFMTDGSRSHRHLISEEELKKIRSSEGMSAARALGLERENVRLLGFKENKLGLFENEVEKKIAEIIEDFKPDEIFLPHNKEPRIWSSDHLETTRIVIQALRKLRKELTIYEYPIWYWYHWPWVSISQHDRNNSKIIFKNTLLYSFGLSTRKDFNHCVPIENVSKQKRVALEQHKSQMTRIIPHKKWATLKDISNGEFIKCFFRSYELFRRYEFILKGV
jgi:LmbE family N-acetylglucosaminyl deacetylase